MSISFWLRIASLVCFILACLSIGALAGIPLLPLGLAFWVASTLP